MANNLRWTQDEVNRALAKNKHLSIGDKPPEFTPRKAVQTISEAKPPKIAKRAKGPNKTELEWLKHLEATHPGTIIRFEAYKLRLADGCYYIPDFAIEYKDVVEFYEVKGDFIFSKALNKPKMAAEVFPQLFRMAHKTKEWGWVVTEFPGRFHREHSK